MGYLNVFLPANSLHANVLEQAWQWVEKELMGLDIIGQSGIPVTTSYQKLCAELWPWLPKIVDIHKSIELLSANNGHALCKHIPKNMREWEVANGIVGDLPIRFFSEFSHPPKGMDFPEEFFFATQGHYSLHSQSKDDFLNGRDEYPPAIKYNDGKIAILMKEPLFGEFMNSFFQFQADPRNQKGLDTLMGKIADIGSLPDDVIAICPLDPEVAYTGSRFGGEIIWTIFCEEVEKRNLKAVFTQLSHWLDYFRTNAVELDHLPEKDLVKWKKYSKQRTWSKKYSSDNYDLTNKNCRLLSLVTSSDILAAWWFKKNSDARIIHGKNLDGSDVTFRISYNPEVIQVSRAAARALKSKEKFSRLLERIGGQSLFISRMREYADKYEL